MIVIFFSRLFYPHIGGVEKHVFEISKILIKKGYKIIVFTEHFDKKLKHKENIKGIVIYRISVGEKKFLKKFRIWRQLWEYRKIIEKADIVHAHDVFFWYLPFRFLFSKKPVYTTFHGYEGNNLPSKKAIFMHKLAEKLSNGNICVGDYLKKWYGTKPNYIIYGGVEISNINPSTSSGLTLSGAERVKYQISNINSKKLKILLIGRLEKDIGIPIYLKTLILLKEKRIDFEFEACGDGLLRKEVERYGKVHGLVENLRPYIEKANIVFASSYLSILEAMKAKKLIFSTFDNPLKEDYLKLSPFAKWIIIENSARSLASRIEHFMNRSSEYEKAVNAGYKWASQQSWQKVTDLYIKLWKHEGIFRNNCS